MIPVKVQQLLLSNMGFVVLLKGAKDERTLPIFIGASEAQAIAIKIEGVDVPRPLTHDLLKNVLDFLECRVLRIEVCALKEGTFFAKLVVERDGMHLTVDCRPSDAIALALRVSAPIFVAEAVMDEAGRVMAAPAAAGESPGESAGKSAARSGAPETKAPPSPPTELDGLNRKLETAIEQERYEDAAKIRDELKRLKGAHN